MAQAKRVIRNAVVFLLFSPFILLVHLTALFRGKENAIRTWSPSVTSMAKKAVSLFVPNIRSADEYGRLQALMRSRLWLWKPLYDVAIREESKDTLIMHITNCPFCEVFSAVGLEGLNPALCQGDWEYARENADTWTFERRHQIGTGDGYCDHTYKRLKREPAAS